MSTQPNFFTLLGLPKNATAEQIRRAYHRAARRFHPDMNSEPEAMELFLRIQEAYEVLSDPERRALYTASIPVVSNPLPPISLSTLYSQSALPVLTEPQLVYALIKLSAPPDSEKHASPPLNVSLVLDRSTSMRGERIDTVKAAAIDVVRQLRPEDMLSIVVFSDRAKVLLSGLWRPDRNEIEKRIYEISAGGGTEILHGLQAGFAEVRRNLSKTYINHIILLTDGHTYGDEAACLELADQASKLGVGISGLGVGDEWNDVFIDKLVTRTGGSSLYVSKPADIKQFLQSKFRSLGQAYACQVSLKMETAREVALRDAYRLQPEPTFLPPQSFLRLGGIPAGAELSILLEFLVAPLPASKHQLSLIIGEFILDIPYHIDQGYNLPLDLTIPVSTAQKNGTPPAAILQAVSQITLFRMQERARLEYAAGNLESTGHQLKKLAGYLNAQGQDELAHTVMIEAERLHKTQSFSQKGLKQIKYGTRGLLLPDNRLGRWE